MNTLIKFLIPIGMLFKASLCFSAVLEKHFYPFWQRATDKTSQQLLLGYIPSQVIAQKSDNQIRDQWRDHRKMHEDDAKYGDRFDTYGLGPAIAITQLWLDPQAGESHVRALIYTALVTQSLKVTIQRQRPSSEDKRSFPSGHTSTAFATATSLTYAYGAKVGLIAYPVATFVGLSRMADDVHWFSDVVSGAFLGIWLGRASFYGAESGSYDISKNDFLFFPSISRNEFALNFQLQF